MKKLIFLILLSLPAFAFSQVDTVGTLIDKGDYYLKKNDFEKASYYFKLALSHNEKSYKKGLFQKQIEDNIHLAESLLAYSSDNWEYVELICKADSLSGCCEMIALKTYQEAYSLNPSNAYPSLQIDSILNSSPEIQKKLLVISAKRKRKQYTDDIELAKFYYDKEDFFKAYKQYEKISIFYKEDTLAKIKVKELSSLISNELERFNNYLSDAENYMRQEKFKKAQKQYQKALSIDSDCNICKIKLKSIEYLLRKNGKKTDWGKLSKEAEENFKLGNYEMAHYQYLWLYKHDSSNDFISERIQQIKQILEDETDDKRSVANAKLLLEKADNQFLIGDYVSAKESYQKIANRYEKSIDNLIYVIERIKDCEHYIKINE